MYVLIYRHTYVVDLLILHNVLIYVNPTTGKINKDTKMFKRGLLALFVMLSSVTHAQTLINQGTYDSKSLVDTNNTSVSTNNVTSNNTNLNTNINTTTVNSNAVNTNYNNNVSTSTSTNTNYQYGTMTNNNNNVSTSNSNSVNQNNNVSNSTSQVNQNSNSVNQNNSNTTANTTSKIIQPPPTAIAPPMMSGGNADLCTTGLSGAAQTQILGISFGKTVRDMNCERLKLSKTLFDMGMKVAAVATMCQDKRVFDAMMSAGTPCPFEGKIGLEAKVLWEENKDKQPKFE